MIWPKDNLTRFETARLIGARSLQISLGAPILTKVEGELEAINIAKKEFREKIIPITVKRKLPDGVETIIDARKGMGNWVEDHKGNI